MSHTILGALNKHRKKSKPRRDRDEKRNNSDHTQGVVPRQDLAIPEDNIEETFNTFHKSMPGGAVNDSTRASDEESEFNQYRVRPAILPKFSKKKLPDYRPGKVKIYSKKEIAQYMKERENE